MHIQVYPGEYVRTSIDTRFLHAGPVAQDTKLRAARNKCASKKLPASSRWANQGAAGAEYSPCPAQHYALGYDFFYTVLIMPRSTNGKPALHL